MRVEIRKRPYDLYAVMAVSTLLVILITINELSGVSTQALRVILGLPFILFFPGYVLISALYPEKKRYFDSNGDPIDKDEWKRIVEEREEDDDSQDESLPDGKGLDNLERVALSLGLSIAITPLIGLVLNYTYDWDPEHLGIRLFPVLISIYAFIIICGSVATYRRNRVAEEDRFEIVIDISVPEDYTTMDKVLTVGIVIMMVASVSLLIYIIAVPREGESFTEFYILGPTGMAEKYPRNMFIEETKFVIIGIGNHEHESKNYTLVMSLSSDASNSTVGSFGNVTVSRTSQPSTSIVVQDEETMEIPCNFSVLESGAYKLRFLLYLDGEEYRDLHLWIKVFEEGRLSRSGDTSVETYITAPQGDPSGIPDSVPSGEPAGIGIGIRNGLDVPLDVDVEMRIGSGGDRIVVEPFQGPFNVSLGNTYVIPLEVNSTSSVDVLPLVFLLPEGQHRVVYEYRWDGGSTETYFRINVGEA